METQFSLGQILFLGYSVKMGVDFVKWITEKEFVKWRVLSFVFGVITAILFNVDALPYLGMYPSIPVFGINYIPFVVLEATWMLVSLFALIKQLKVK